MSDTDNSQANDNVQPTSATTTSRQTPTLDMIDSIVTLGPEKLTGIAGALLLVIGYFAPLVTAQTGGLFSADSSVSYQLVQTGLPGILILALGLALALLPFYKEHVTFANRDIIAYGVSCGFLGTFVVLWLVSLSLPVVISSVGGLSGGFYALMFGFAFTVYATVKMLKNAAPRANP